MFPDSITIQNLTNAVLTLYKRIDTLTFYLLDPSPENKKQLENLKASIEKEKAEINSPKS